MIDFDPDQNNNSIERNSGAIVYLPMLLNWFITDENSFQQNLICLLQKQIKINSSIKWKEIYTRYRY